MNYFNVKDIDKLINKILSMKNKNNIIDTYNNDDIKKINFKKEFTVKCVLNRFVEQIIISLLKI